MSNSVGSGTPNVQQVQTGVQGAQQEILEQQDFNFQLSKFQAEMPHFQKGENTDVISIFSKPKDLEDKKDTKSRSSETADGLESKNIFAPLLSIDEPEGKDEIDLINQECGLEINAKDYLDVWGSIKAISEKLANEEEKTRKEVANTIKAFNEPLNIYQPAEVVINAFDETQFRKEFVA